MRANTTIWKPLFWLTLSTLSMWIASQDSLPGLKTAGPVLISAYWWIQYAAIFMFGYLLLSWCADRTGVTMQVDVLGDHITLASIVLLGLASVAYAAGGNPLWAAAFAGGWMWRATLLHLDVPHAHRS